MTEKEMTLDLAKQYYRLLAWKTAAEVYLSLLRENGASLPWQTHLDQAANQDVSAEGLPFQQKLERIERALAQSKHDSPLQALYEEITQPE